MNAAPNSAYEYQVGGSLPINAPTYVVRQADQDLYDGLKAGDFCYVLNSRQMGKSSLRVQTMQRLQAESVACSAIDLTRIGSQHVTPAQWYAGIVLSLVSSFKLSGKFNLRTWWRDHELLSPVQRLSEFIEEVLLAEVPQSIVIFVDEIDSVLSLNFSIDDFFAVIRDCYNQRADKPEYRRLTFTLLGVATPSDLIQDKSRTPFNIGRAIELNGFQLDEAQPLAQGLLGKVSNPQAMVKEVLAWTGGQPFLTQKLCKLIVASPSPISSGGEALWIEDLVRSHIIENWESQDEPEHLRTIRDRILQSSGQRTGRLLGLYQQIVQQKEVATDESPEQMELRLTGLVVRREGKLRAYNRIYALVFNQSWVDKALADLRPYAEALNAWIAYDSQDESRLLRGQALQDAVAWATNKNLSRQDYQFLTASQEFDMREAQKALEAERQALEAEQARKALEVEKQANRILAEAQEKAELALEEERKANQRAKRTIRRGFLGLAAISALAITVVVGAGISREKAQQKLEDANAKTQQAERKVWSAEARLQKVNEDAKQRVQQADQKVASARAKLKKAEQDTQAANQKVQTAKQIVQQANQEVASAGAKLEKAEQDAQAANQKVQTAKQIVQQANQKVAFAKIELKKAEQATQNVSQLAELGEKLYGVGQHSAAEQAWTQAALSFEIPEHRLKQAMLLSNISLAYQQLDQWPQATKAASDSLNLLRTEVDSNVSNTRLPLLVHTLNVQGILLGAQGDTRGALSAYTEALDILQTLRSDLVTIKPAIQASLQNTIRPAFRDFARLLLQSEETRSDQRNLMKVRQVIESLQLTELKGSLQIAPSDANLAQIHQIDPTAAVIYPIIFDDRLEVILHLPHQPLRHYTTPIPQEKVESIAIQMRQSLFQRTNTQSLQFSQRMYDWLIRPAEADLVRSKVKTLVFVPDSSLRNIPMAALHDGKQYLMEKYAIAITPGLELLEPQPPLPRGQFKALVAGISKPNQGYPALTFVELELNQILSQIPGKKLLNEEFTNAALENAINSFYFPIVHLATRGQFSSKPEDTFLFTWDGHIDANQLGDLFRTGNQGRSSNIELLVLSGCDTVQRDEKTPFGLAGVAVRAGVRSTLGALWSADDEATASLMSRFYRELGNATVTKAEALRRAQQSILQDPKYRRPYSWAPFVLVGNWL